MTKGVSKRSLVMTFVVVSALSFCGSGEMIEADIATAGAVLIEFNTPSLVAELTGRLQLAGSVTGVPFRPEPWPEPFTGPIAVFIDRWLTVAPS